MDKRSLYRTAVVTSPTYTHNGEFDLAPGDHVAVTFLGEKVHPWYRVPMGLFQVSKGGQDYGHMWEKHLDRFVF